MSLQAHFAELAGDWIGTKQVWLAPGQPVRESETAASVALPAGGQFATVRYTWADEGKPQDGLLVVRRPAEADSANAPRGGSAVEMVWIDSWHMRDAFMVCDAEPAGDGELAARGSYAAPPGPDWGWRITLRMETADSFVIVMDNILPDGREARAVEMKYRRRD